MYSSTNVDVLSLNAWGPDHVLQPSNQAHLIIPHFSGRGSCIKISWFIQCIHLPMLMYSHWSSGGRITSYSHRIKRIISFPTFLGGGAAFVKPGKRHPEVSSGLLRMVKISWFIQCIHLPTGPNHILQPLHQMHLIISHFSGRGSCVKLERVAPRWVLVHWCRYRFSWKAISTCMSLTLARLCGEWQLVSKIYCNFEREIRSSDSDLSYICRRR